jgi:hypothetical protein
MGVNLPKVHYLFYEYFFRPVIGEANWKRRFAERKRFGTNIAEAYGHALLENNYHAWVYDYLTKTPLSTLKTEYEYAKEDNNANENQGTNDDANESKIFSGDLDKVEIAMPATEGLGDFLLCLDETEDEYKAAQEAALVVTGEVVTPSFVTITVAMAADTSAPTRRFKRCWQEMTQTPPVMRTLLRKLAVSGQGRSAS